MKFIEKLKKYRENDKLSLSDLAEKLEMEVSELEDIENGNKILNDEEQNKILEKLDIKFTTKKILKMMDLIFRLSSMIMALVTLLLCIKGGIDTEVLVSLLSIGLVCSSLTMLPKIEK